MNCFVIMTIQLCSGKQNFHPLNTVCCDELIIGDKFTYVNNSLGHRSSLDHFFVSRKTKHDLLSLQILHSGANLSDHLPVIAKFNWSAARLGPDSDKKTIVFVCDGANVTA